MHSIHQKKLFKCALYYTLGYQGLEPYDINWIHRTLPIAVYITEYYVEIHIKRMYEDAEVLKLPASVSTEEDFVNYMNVLAAMEI